MSEVSKDYSRALYELAEEEHAEDEYLSEAREIGGILAAFPDYIRLLGAPNVPVGERTAMLDESFGGRCREYILSFMKLMVERGYACFLRECFCEFENIYLERHGIVRASVRTAIGLDQGRIDALRAKLEQYSGKTVEMTVTTDPSLIGGIRVELDGKLLEGSVRSRLDKLRSDITGITI